ncbi:MAG: FtsB family cell division protein [Candidatus Komeilibacteria bacterium]
MSQGGFRKFYNSVWFLWLCVILLALFLGATWRDYHKQSDLRDDIAALNQEITNLDQQQSDLLETLKYVQSSDFVEIEARTKLNLRKPGEKVIIVSSDEDIANLPASKESNINRFLQPTISNYQKWWSYFFPSR